MTTQHPNQPASDENGEVEVLFGGRFVEMVQSRGWEYVRRTGCSGVALIVAVTPGSELLLVEQYRPPVASRVIELPAGLVGDHAGGEGESIETGALRELEEETGYTAAAMTILTSGPVSAGLTSEVITFLLASDLTRVGAGGGDENEDITVHSVPLQNVEEWLSQKQESGVWVDPKVYAGLHFARRS